MTIFYKQVTSNNTYGASVTHYTVPANTEVFLLGILITNPTSWAVPADANNDGTLSMKLGGVYLFKDLHVPMLSTHEILNGQKMMMEAGETIVTEGTGLTDAVSKNFDLIISLMEVS